MINFLEELEKEIEKSKPIEYEDEIHDIHKPTFDGSIVVTEQQNRVVQDCPPFDLRMYTIDLAGTTDQMLKQLGRIPTVYNYQPVGKPGNKRE